MKIKAIIKCAITFVVIYFVSWSLTIIIGVNQINTLVYLLLNRNQTIGSQQKIHPPTRDHAFENHSIPEGVYWCHGYSPCPFIVIHDIGKKDKGNMLWVKDRYFWLLGYVDTIGHPIISEKYSYSEEGTYPSLIQDTKGGYEAQP